MNGPQAGDAAPDFEAPAGGGSPRLPSLGGKTVVPCFYPKDDTPGCAREARGFRDNMAALSATGGVSGDGVTRHDAFKAKHGPGFPLVSDDDGATCEAYGAWGEKKNHGGTYMGVERATFPIGADGKVVRIWRKVKVAGHAEAVTEAARALA